MEHNPPPPHPTPPPPPTKVFQSSRETFRHDKPDNRDETLKMNDNEDGRGFYENDSEWLKPWECGRVGEVPLTHMWKCG